ncbi:MAG: D-alanine--D-alanine ligase [Selenomonadaceae bacterium]|nr:D-alanine--D-alanine ligase [Selenomonadaceae bacterium]
MALNQGKIVVVMGGPSSEAEVSRRSGGAILKALQEKGYNAVGLEFQPKSFQQQILAEEPAIVFNAMHGAYGEDGRLAALLDCLDIPYTSSGVLASSVTMDKCAAKSVLLAADIPTPAAVSLFSYEDRAEQVARVEKRLSFPVIVKAAEQGSSIGVYRAADRQELSEALEMAFSYGKTVLAEEIIEGPELTAAVWGGDGRAEVLPVIEITTVTGSYDYETKYKKGASTHIIPARISEAANKRVQELAKRTFIACDLSGISRIDFMLGQDDTPYAIDINTVPGMTETSLVPDAAAAVGMDFTSLCERLLELAGFQKEV